MAWSYSGDSGPKYWHNSYSSADGHRQSPIDIEAAKWKIINSCSKQKFKTHYLPGELAHLHNTGRTWSVRGENMQSHISGGPLNHVYALTQIHAHWRESLNGSEHTIDGKHYACELHLVHWNTSYKTLEEALEHEDGYSVIALFFKLGESHPEIQKIVEHLPDIMHKNDVVNLQEPINLDLLLPSNMRYWSYYGSLTTPPCKECVIWIVLHEPVEISEEQLNSFRKLRCHTKQEPDCEDLNCEDKMNMNARPVYPLGQRLIIRTRYKGEKIEQHYH